jgi:hypothetical protein
VRSLRLWRAASSANQRPEFPKQLGVLNAKFTRRSSLSRLPPLDCAASNADYRCHLLQSET